MPYVSRKKSMPTRRRRSYKNGPSRRKGLSKTERVQVKSIAKSAVNACVESKYFNVNGGVTDEQPSPIWQIAGQNSEISCWGFTTGSRRDYGTNATYNWGVSPVDGSSVAMDSLNLNQLFRTNAVPASRAQYALEGLECRPSYNEVQWLFERRQSNTIADPSAGMPYKVRMLRLVPRATKASYQAIDPQNDCFLDELGEPFGPSSVSGASPLFDRRAFYLAKANSRRYKVIADTTFGMLPSSIRTDIFAPLNSGQGNDNPLVNQPSMGGVKVIKTKHDLGKVFHYENPNESSASGGSQYPSTGFEPEFVLFLVSAVGGVDAAGDLTDNISLSARCVSTFKDA